MEGSMILVIDDDPDILEILRITLEANSYKVSTASSGTEGLAAIKRIKPDLIILDVMMDTITEGFQVSYKLRNPDPASEYAEFVKMPILMLTGIREKTKMKFSPHADGAYLPVDDYLEKPVQPKVLLDKVKTLLQDRS
ncbi:MAG: response regulator [Smithellaceae bacterium]|nr:response regulator [Smithellaceae bacterium]